MAALQQAKGDPEVVGRVRALGGDVFAGEQAQAVNFLAQQQALWGKVVRERGITRE